jgi:hypothetical protein
MDEGFFTFIHFILEVVLALFQKRNLRLLSGAGVDYS